MRLRFWGRRWVEPCDRAGEESSSDAGEFSFVVARFGSDRRPLPAARDRRRVNRVSSRFGRGHAPPRARPRKPADGDKVLAFVRPENIEGMVNSSLAEESNIVRGHITQIVFEGPTLRLIVDAQGVSIKITAGGLERLTLLDQERRDVVLRLQAVTVVRDEPAVAA
jgi:hypothetical protein